ncbi:hypothetical protein F383_06726 [Gossypium arboreum]|uniref:Uncharacterized protein n=1 Tax=Gossypium arboreum TaxID=29729 RepID=A0A0B0N220_GOSAR|nr:hypothetical protein F383_06726 [Gossypium arboreum]
MDCANINWTTFCHMVLVGLLSDCLLFETMCCHLHIISLYIRCVFLFS